MAIETQHLSSPEPPNETDDANNNDVDEHILPKGAVIQNRYEIVKVLGIGGMGAVYLAKDLRFTGIARMCALKEMNNTTPDPQLRRINIENFGREANLLAQLKHPGIPPIYDYFTEAVRSYLVMEYVEGSDLEDVLGESTGMLAEKTVLEWAVQVCDVLVYLHSQDPPIVFRDLKPANIMLRQSSKKICLIDFGIAKVFEVGQKGTMIGTEGYSPPEQYRGVAEPRGDVYALGATMHHLLTKRDPRLETPFTFQDEPVRLLNPAVSEETNAMIMKALEYEPEKRYPSAQEFKKALEAALRGEATNLGNSPSVMGTRLLSNPPATGTRLLDQASLPETKPPPATPPPPQRQQYPPQQYPPQQYPPPQYPPQQPPPAGYPPHQYPPQPYPPYPYPPQPPPGAAPGWGEDPAAPQEEEDSIIPIWKFKCEDEIRGRSPTADETALYVGAYDNNVYALDLKDGEFQWKYPTDGGIAVKPALYKDRLVFGSEDQVAYAITTSGRLIWTCPTEGRIRSSAVVAFDHAFFGSDDQRLYAVNAQTGRVIWRHEAMGPIRSSPVLGDELVYVGSEDRHLYAIDLSSGATKWKFRANRGITSSPTLYDDKIIVGSSDWNVYSLEAKSGYTNWRVRTNNEVISSPTIFDDIIYIGSTDKNMYAIDIKTGRVHWKFNAESPIVSTPAVTDEAVYFGTIAGEVMSLNRKDKKVRWRFKTGGAITSSPLINDGIVYIGSTDHYVYALPT